MRAVSGARVRWIRLTATAMTCGTQYRHREQISPELVLVDPELAQSARERLATEPFPRFAPRPPAAAASTRARTGDSGRRRSWVRPALAAAFAVGAVGTLAAIAAVATDAPSSLTRWIGGDARDAARVPDPVEGAVAPGTTIAPPAATAQGRSTAAPPARPRQTGRANSQAPRRRAGSSSGGGRVFAWPRAARTHLYVVEFFRGRRKIYREQRSAARLTLPPRWTFRGRRYRLVPGRYRWQVRAYPGAKATPRPGKLIVNAALEIRAGRRG